MFYINPLGRNWGPTVNWDSLGKIYAALAISWTVILYSGIAWLVAHRQLPCLKMRNIPLAVAATSFLHVYLVKIMLAYTTNGHFLCSAEFWIMSIYLPFGIALFQANQVQLLSISTQQRKLLDGERLSIHEPYRCQRSLWSRWRSLSALKQTYVFIGMGMLLQVMHFQYVGNRSLQISGRGNSDHLWNKSKTARPLGQDSIPTRTSCLPERSRMDPISILADVLVLHIWSLPSLQASQRPRYSSLATPDHPLRDIRVSKPPLCRS